MTLRSSVTVLSLLLTAACGQPEFTVAVTAEAGATGDDAGAGGTGEPGVGGSAGSTPKAGGSVGGGTAGSPTGAAGAPVSQTGGTAGVGGSAGGSAGEGSASAGSGSAGAAGSPASSCVAPYAAALTDAIAQVLPSAFTWQDMTYCGAEGSCLMCTLCKDDTCGSCSLEWSAPSVLPDGARAYADVTVTCSDVSARATCGSSTPANCGVTMQGVGTVQFQLDAAVREGSAVSWVPASNSVLLDWTLSTTCRILSSTEVGADISAELSDSLGGLVFSTSCE